MSIFHIRLKELRTKKNIMQKSLSELLEVTPRGIRYYENGTREPSYDKLIALADYFDVSTDYLLGRTDNPDSHKV